MLKIPLNKISTKLSNNFVAINKYVFMIKKAFLLLAVVFIAHNVFSTNPTDALSAGVVKGFVFDSLSKQPLEYATVSIVKENDKAAITGSITDATGFFKLKGVENGRYSMEIAFIGYYTKKITGLVIGPNQKTLDIGQVFLKPATQTMEEVVVTTDRPTMQYKIDKKVLNVSQMHTSASGTATELLESIPSVTVDVEGNVSLRGSTSFTVLIDGKPTLLDPSDALSQIPASQIENIEIITNPSAKFDPDGVAGIINIIMKKNKLQGVSGIVNVNGGTQNRYGGDFLVTYRKEKLNYYVGADWNNREFIGKATNNRTVYGDTTSYLFSNGNFTRGRNSYSVRGGIDYTINPFNTVSLGVNVGNRNGKGHTDLTYNSWTNPGTVTEKYYNKENSDRSGDFYNATLDYNHKFSKKGHELVGQAIFEKSNSNDNDITKTIDINDIITNGQKSTESGPETEYRLKLDYTLPTGEKSKFEAGAQSRFEDQNEANNMYYYNMLTGIFEFQPLYSHDVDYKTNIHSVYSTYSGESGNLGYQFGLREEYTYRKIALKGENQNFTLNRFDYYPTVHVSYGLPSDQQVMASYTRRISRIRGYYLEPFITWEDAHNVRQGNPSLKPEYIDSYELSYKKNFGKNIFSADLYYRITNNKIERVQSIYNTNDSLYQNTIIFLNTIDNVGKDYSLGGELMLGLDFAKWWHTDIMGDVYDYREKGSLLGENFSKSSFNWNVRLNNTFKIAKFTRIQLNGMYNSPSVTAQGKTEGFLMTNLAVKQDFMKNKVSLTLQVRDLFHTMKHEMTSEGDNFYTYRKFQPNSPMISMTLTVRLNNYKLDRKRQQQDNNGTEDMDVEGM